MAQPYVTGPVPIYVSIQLGGGPVFLGYAESAPEIDEQPEWEPVFCDVAGSRIPFDEIYQGEHHFVFADLTSWNEQIYQKISSRPNAFTGVTGTNVIGDVGTLMRTEGFTYVLHLPYTYVVKPAMGQAGLRPGRRYYAAYFRGPGRPVVGTRANKRHVAFHCMRAYSPTTGAFTLYDEVMTGIPAIPPPGPLGV